MLWETENYNALPWAGGILDQPHILMRQLSVCRAAHNKVLSLKQKQLEEQRKLEKITKGLIGG